MTSYHVMSNYVFNNFGKMKKFSYDSLNTSMVDVMNNMTSFVSTNERLALPKPSIEFTTIQQLLIKTELNVVVCGKVKNGKSSLINAIIGREILPVCSDVATSQIFKISHTELDKFNVVFANGNKQEITQAELTSFGSQSDIDKNGIKSPDQAISFIEVGTKMEFLPLGVSLIDTPGIGSTYSQHTAITKKCVQMADAALFVMNPSPLEKIEIEFLKELADITPNIMFVMTKAEDIDSVKENIARNTSLIENAIGKKLYREVHIFPMSSTTLMDAAHSSDEESVQFNLEVSGYEDVKDELLYLVSLSKGYYRVGEAFNCTLQYYNQVLDNLQNRLEVAQSNGQKSLEISQKITAARNRLSEFDRTRRQQLINDIDLRLKAFSQTFQQKMLSGGPVASAFFNEIESLESDGLQSYADSLGNKLINSLQQEWGQLQRALEKDISSLLLEYTNDLKLGPDGHSGIVTTIPCEPSALERVGFRKRALNARNEAMIGIGGLTIMSYLGATAIPIVGPIIVIGALGYTLYGLFAGNTRAKAEVLKSNQGKLKQFVQDTIKDFYKQYTEVSLEDGKYNSVVDGYKHAIREYALNTLVSIHQAYEQEVQVLESIQAGNKSESVTILRGVIEKWEKKGTELKTIRQQLEVISNSLK